MLIIITFVLGSGVFLLGFLSHLFWGRLRVQYDCYYLVRLLVALELIVYATICVKKFALREYDPTVASDKMIASVHIIFWTLGPSLWFFLEYVLIDMNGISIRKNAYFQELLKINSFNYIISKEAFLKNTKEYADIASKIWAAVLAALIFLFPKT